MPLIHEPRLEVRVSHPERLVQYLWPRSGRLHRAIEARTAIVLGLQSEWTPRREESDLQQRSWGVRLLATPAPSGQ